MSYCCVKWCGRNTKTSSRAKDGITFHRFPADPVLKKVWIEACRRGNWFPSKTTRMCSQHFDETCFHAKSSDDRRWLLENAVPTKHLPIMTDDKHQDSSSDDISVTECSDSEPDIVPPKKQRKTKDINFQTSRNATTLSVVSSNANSSAINITEETNINIPIKSEPPTEDLFIIQELMEDCSHPNAPINKPHVDSIIKPKIMHTYSLTSEMAENIDKTTNPIPDDREQETSKIISNAHVSRFQHMDKNTLCIKIEELERELRIKKNINRNMASQVKRLEKKIAEKDHIIQTLICKIYAKKADKQEKSNIGEEEDTLHKEKEQLYREDKSLKKKDLLFKENKSIVNEDNQLFNEKELFVRDNNQYFQEKDSLVNEDNLFLKEKGSLVREDNLCFSKQEAVVEEPQLFKEKQSLVNEENLGSKGKEPLVKENSELFKENTTVKEDNSFIKNETVCEEELIIPFEEVPYNIKPENVSENDNTINNKF